MSDAPSSAKTLAALLSPAEPVGDRAATARRPGPMWFAEELPLGVPPVQLLAAAGRRELRVLRSRVAGAGRASATVVRLQPTARRRGWRARARGALAPGVVVRHGPSPQRTALEALLPVEVSVDLTRLRCGSGGSVLLPGRAGGQPVLVRVGSTGTPADPARAAAALRRLEQLRTTRVPRLLAAGRAGGQSWSVEEWIPGRPVRALTPALLDDAVDFLAALPAAAGAPAPPPRDLVAHVPPALRRRAEALVEEAALAGPWPAAARHGDCWTGNLLTVRGRLSGVVDWDAFDEGGVLGLDVLHLLATAERLERRASSGEVLLAGFWRQPRVQGVVGELLARRGAAPPETGLDGLALRWWLESVTADLRRNPCLVSTPGWMRRNVFVVLEGWPQTTRRSTST